MGALNSFWEEANQSWDLIRLYQDLNQAKGRELTDLQKAILRGALCGVGLKEVARQLNRKLNGLRTDLSSGLYRFIEVLLLNRDIEEDKKVCWQKIPRLLTLADYAVRSPESCYVKSPKPCFDLESISLALPTPDIVRAREIIEIIEEQRLDKRCSGDQTSDSRPKLSPEVAEQLAINGDSAWKAQNYTAAIDFYRIPIEQDLRYASVYTSLMVKIAMCYDKLGLYVDSVEMAWASRALTSDVDEMSKLYGVLGSAFHELAIHTRDERTLKLALDYYQQSTGRTQGINVLGAWNKFDLLSRFSLLNIPDSDKFLKTAKLAFCDFKEMTLAPGSNFENKTYKKMILQDAQRIRSALTDKWLCDELENFING